MRRPRIPRRPARVRRPTETCRWLTSQPSPAAGCWACRQAPLRSTHLTASTHETTLRRNISSAEAHIEVTQRVVAAGLTLEETAAIAAGPLVRRGNGKVLDGLDQVVQALRDADFGTEHHRNPADCVRSQAPCQVTAMN
jgi:hypothetical protein